MKEQNELLEAALKLAEFTGRMCLDSEMREAREVIERHRPKPERLEGWVNYYGPAKHGHVLFPSKEHAESVNDSENGRTVHMREVVPVEFEKWTASPGGAIWQGSKRIWNAGKQEIAEGLCEAHNAEMERIANA